MCSPKAERFLQLTTVRKVRDVRGTRRIRAPLLTRERKNHVWGPVGPQELWAVLGQQLLREWGPQAYTHERPGAANNPGSLKQILLQTFQRKDQSGWYLTLVLSDLKQRVHRSLPQLLFYVMWHKQPPHDMPFYLANAYFSLRTQPDPFLSGLFATPLS